MALRPCKECKKEISSEAKVCPHCGKKQGISTGVALLTAIGVLVLLGYLANLLNKNSESGGGSNPTPTTSTPAGGVAPARPKYAIGQEFSVGYWTYRCNGANWQPFIGSGFGSVERPDAAFLVLDLTVRNDDRTSSTLPPLKLIDSQGREFDESSKGIFLEGSFGALKQLNPGVSSRGLVVFDVPNGEYMLKVSGGFESGKDALVVLSGGGRQEPGHEPEQSSPPMGVAAPNGTQSPPNNRSPLRSAQEQATANVENEPTPEQRINSLLDDWVQSFRQKDVAKQVECYAPQVDIYYRQHNVSRAFIEADKSRAFAALAGIQKFELSNVGVYLDSAGAATVTFDKSWDTTLTSGRRFAGSEMERLSLALVDGHWKIKSEEELRIYNVTQ
jgi:hypothetical protein